MAFKGITFAGQNVRPQDDGALYFAHYGDGILDGCSMAISGDDLVIQSGHFIASGRVCHVDGATNVDLSGRGLSTGYIQVIMNYDMSQAEGSQWYTSYVESASTTFPALTQGNINDNDTLYQVELAVIQISGGNLTTIYSSMRVSDVVVKSATATGTLRPSEIGPDVLLCAEGGNVILRPNGIDDGAGQTFIRPDGQMVGGHPTTSDDGTTSTPITANSFKNLASLTGLESQGTYIVYAKANFKPTNTTATELQLALSNQPANNNLGIYQSRPSSSDSAKGVVLGGVLVSGYTTLYLNFMSTGIGGNVTSWHFRAVRID